MKRVAVVDIGSNSTRLLIADVDEHGATQVERRTNVTRLGDGVDQTGRLYDEPMQRVESVLADYRKLIDESNVDTVIGLMTSAVRDAANGEQFLARADVVSIHAPLNEHTRDLIDAAALRAMRPGTILVNTSRGGLVDQSALLEATYITAALDVTDPEPPAPDSPLRNEPNILLTPHVAVVDIGGGSTEIVTGAGFNISVQMGVVRFTERHLHHDPPEPEELQRLTAAVREVLGAVLPARPDVQTLVAVAGTATSAAALAHDVEPYDPDRIHGARVTMGDLEEILARLAILTNAERREVRGLHPDRAPTIVAGIAILLETVRAFGLDELEVSEHDILVGAALNEERGRAGTG